MKRTVKVSAVLGLFYLLATMPRIKNRPDISSMKGRYYAHRGLHGMDKTAPENSLEAFRRAAASGYGIELDVQLTKDGIPVVFHDETLRRVCGVRGSVREYTYQELEKFSLLDSKEKIPKLQTVLELIQGSVPLIIEIKVYEDAAKVCSAADRLLARYQGEYCMESFHPLALAWYRKNRPEVIRGQLSSCFSREGAPEPLEQRMVHYLLFNFFAAPDFIAYDLHYKGNLSRRICRWLYRIPSVAWTVRSQGELESCRSSFDAFIFENFRPEM